MYANRTNGFIHVHDKIATCKHEEVPINTAYIYTQTESMF